LRILRQKQLRNNRWMQDVLEKLCVKRNGRRTKFERNLIRLSGYLMKDTLKGKGDGTSGGKIKLQCRIQANIIDLYAEMQLLSFLLMCFLFWTFKVVLRNHYTVFLATHLLEANASALNYYKIFGESSNPI